MISRFKILAHIILTLLLGVMLASCQDTLPARATIDPGRQLDPEEPCPEGYELVEDDSPQEGEEGEEGEEDEALEDDGPKLVCKLKPIPRPSGAVFFKSDYCACKDGKAISYGNCSSFCAGKNTGGSERLYANFTVGPDIALSGLGSVHGWCTALMPGDESNPVCKLEARSEDGALQIDVNVLPGTNSLTANVQDVLAYDKTYVLTLVETVSGARSNSIQIVKFSEDINVPILGPLKVAPISQYTCLLRQAEDDEELGDIYFTDAYRLHFYFLPRNPPPAVPAVLATSIVCHDFLDTNLTRIDDETYPRMETIPGVFSLWDNMDARFFDNNGNGTADISDIIIQKVKSFGGTVAAGTKFLEPWPFNEGVEVMLKDGGVEHPTLPLGYYMPHWIDNITFKSYCLNSTHYNSDNPLFKALRDVIGVDTEGIYMGYKAPETIQNSDGSFETGQPDRIFVRETDLKSVWFYLNAGVPTVPTDDNVSNVAVFFYYPFNKASPFVKSSTQRLYRVLGPQDNPQTAGGGTGTDSGNGNTSGGSTSKVPPHDRKIGCVPKF